MYEQMPFAANPLNRVHNERVDEAWLAERRSDPLSRFLALRGLEPLVVDGEGPALAWLTPAEVEGSAATLQPFLLGLDDGAARYAVDVSRSEGLIDKLACRGRSFRDARAVASDLETGEAGILAQARSLVDWHRRHGFCAKCGGKTVAERGGSQRRCPSCSRQHFPRTDPVVIMVVWQGDECLLARRKGRPGAFFSALAGFIDQGETIEDAVRREVSEEAGLRVDEVLYRGSQPWPFPAALMIGCFAHVIDTDVRIDDDEIGEARWLKRDAVQSALAGEDPSLQVPGPVAIAHHLIADWCRACLSESL